MINGLTTYTELVEARNMVAEVTDDPGRERVVEDHELGKIILWASMYPNDAEDLARKLLTK